MDNNNTESKWDYDDGLFRAALDSIGDDNGSLNDCSYLESMLRVLVLELTKVTSVQDIQPSVVRIAKTLLGIDTKCVVSLTWNAPGGIDAFVAHWCGIDDVDPVMRVAGAVMRFVSDVLDVIAYSQHPGVKSEHWKPQIDALLKQYALLFIGVSPPDQMIMS
jgi:hypothetical protein